MYEITNTNPRIHKERAVVKTECHCIPLVNFIVFMF